MKLSFWKLAGLGCLSIVAMVVAGVVAAVIWAKVTVAQLGDTTPTAVERTISLPASRSLPAEATPEPAAAGPSSPLRLTIDLREGDFTVQPGPPGGQVEVQGTYSPAMYELVEDTQTEGPSPSKTIRFRSKAPAWARLLASIGGGGPADQPRLTVRIPAGMPMELALHVSMGESRINLGGLALRTLDLDVSMGEHRIDFREPVAEGLQRVRVNASMGDVSVENLGNTRAPEIEAHGSMGNLTANLGGAWEPGSDARLNFTHSMGEVTLNVPTTVRLETDISRAEGQAGTRSADAPDTRDPQAPVLRLRVSSSMGESRVNRY
jgi:hypothetical protein